MRAIYVSMLSLALATSAWAAPPTMEIPAEVKPVGEYVTLIPKTDAVSITYVGLSGIESFPSDFLKDPRSFLLPVRGLKEGNYRFSAIGASATGEQVRRDFVVVIGTPPTPGPVTPDDPVVPTPAKEFRVIFVRESMKNLPPEFDAVMYGAKVEEYLTKNATGGKEGFKRRDPDEPAGPGVMGEIWMAAKAKMKATDPPCVVVQKDGNVEIIKFEQSPEAMIAVFDKYLKGAK